MELKNIHEEVTERYYGSVCGYCLAVLGDEDTAEACADKVFRRFMRKKIECGTDLKAWLLKTADKILKSYKVRSPTVAELSQEFGDYFQEIFSQERVRNLLTAEEHKLAVDFYVSKKSLSDLATLHKISTAELCKNLFEIRLKLHSEEEGNGKNNEAETRTG
jgi:DNA-directed RNA polymerase specialized sigma24 family protein